jgi:hypothetical protein
VGSKHVTVEFSDEEHALCSQAAEQGGVAEWLRELAIREASLVPSENEITLARYGLADVKSILADLQAQLADDASKAKALELLATFEGWIFRALDHMERSHKLLELARRFDERVKADD